MDSCGVRAVVSSPARKPFVNPSRKRLRVPEIVGCWIRNLFWPRKGWTGQLFCVWHALYGRLPCYPRSWRGRLHKPIHLRVRVPYDKLADLVRGVINPLRQDGAELEVEVYLQARSQQGGFKKSTLEQKVRETLQQIGADIKEEQLT